jgi:hypothetical protein
MSVGADCRLMWETAKAKKDESETDGLNVSYSVGFPINEKGKAAPELAHTVGVGYYWATDRGSSLRGHGRLTGTFEGFAIFLPTDVILMGLKHKVGMELAVAEFKDGDRFTLTLGAELGLQLLRIAPGPGADGTLGFDLGGFLAFGWSTRVAGE